MRWLVWVAAVVVACGTDGGGSEPGASGGTGGTAGGAVCVPGQQVACACGGGVEGAQACLNDGSGFDYCVCPDGGSGGAVDAAVDTGATGGTAGSAGVDAATAGSAGSDASDGAAGTGGVTADAATDTGPTCGSPATFAACSAKYPAAAAKVQQCICNCGYSGCPNCFGNIACGLDFCTSTSTGSMNCQICMGWFFSTWPNKCPKCLDGSCKQFLDCVTC